MTFWTFSRRLRRASEFPGEELAKIEDAKTSKRFDDKVSYAAKLMPPHLRPGGENPIDKLHDLASDGLHSKSEEECIQIFDRCRHVFRVRIFGTSRWA